MSETAVTIATAETDAHMDGVRALCTEYHDWLQVDLCFQGFEEEMRTLPGKYAPPGGCFLLAREGDDIAGGVGVRPVGPGLAEMKRLYVRPRWRGRGIGRRLAVRAIHEARERGYAAFRLDTLAQMEAARSLYKSLGFAEIPAYYDNPEGGVTFMELVL